MKIKSTIPFHQRWLTSLMMLGFLLRNHANPTGLTVVSGTATTQTSGSQLTINTSASATLNWQSFNIGSGERTVFNQPSSTSLVVNQINDQNPSQIFGTLQANGLVVLMNQSGFYFGPNSFVSAAGLTVTTANFIPPQNVGGAWQFNGPPPLAAIVNYGSIRVGNGGSAYLIADKVENHGDIEAPGGSIGLVAGQTVTLSERPDGRGMTLQVTLPQGSVDNYGNLVADAGTIALNAKVVNQNGMIQANSVRSVNGEIELVASDSLNLGTGSQISAVGDAAAVSSGGKVILKSGNTFSDEAGSTLATSGSALGGNGGEVELSAPNIQSLYTGMDASAQSGWISGSLLLDPANIILGTTGSGVPNNSGVLAYNAGSGTVSINVNTAFANKHFSQITLQATGNITVNANTTWDLSASTGMNQGQMTLEAGGNIIFNNRSLITDANNWSVTLDAGYNFANNSVNYNVGNIYLNGSANGTASGAIQTSAGSINLLAGQNVLVGAGYVITTGGGSINAQALSGNINTGSDAQGYHFNRNAGSLAAAYDLSAGLGGISTAAGGNVQLTAGGNISSVLPTSAGPGRIGYLYNGTLYTSILNGLPSGGHTDFATAGCGAYGNLSGQSGNVTLIAGGNVIGNYLVANGVGSINAGIQMDSHGNPIVGAGGNYALGSIGSAGTSLLNPNLALNLINGGWNVNAAQNIALQEVRNPNGVFDISGGAAYNHYFDYGLNDYVNLNAGNLVQLGASASSLPRYTGVSIPVIYPSILDVTAGAGGVILGGAAGAPNSLTLFPSPQGSLSIATTHGGSLIGALDTIQGAPQLFDLVVSDSSASQYISSASFGPNENQAAIPIHLNHPTPITLSISGDMNLVSLTAPEASHITVGGNMNNCSYQGVNLRAADVTSINVGGDIIDRSAFTSVDLTSLSSAPGWQAPNLSLLGREVGGSISAATLLSSIFYNSTTRTLTYQNIPGVPIASVLALLQNMTVQQVDSHGNLLWQDSLDTIPLTETVSVINPATASALLAQYNALGAIPLNASGTGLFIGGGGQFNITGRNIDLGTSAGIQSLGVGLFSSTSANGTVYPLAGLFGTGGVFQNGANIAVTSSGYLDLYSSSIASLNGGNISINAGGQVNAGSTDFSVNSSSIRGIYSSGVGGDVSVIAGSDVNVNGSRIASYDGGNVTVESLHGNINAGTGASTPVSVLGYYENPNSHQVYQTSPQLPFSGIVALTMPPRDSSYPAPVSSLGGILVEALNGNVTANVSGILQIALNNVNYPDALVTVLAGYQLVNAAGQPVSAANMSGATAQAVSSGRDINATGSGIIASNARLDASGDINGLIFARNNINIAAQQNVNVTALGGENVTVSAVGSVSGTIIGVGSVTASGGSIEASLVSANVTGSTSGQSGLGAGTAANATSQGIAADTSKTSADKSAGTGDEEDPLKKKKGIALAQKVSRVTVILPPRKTTSELKTKEPSL